MNERTRTAIGECHVPGTAAGPVLFADLGLSFMGGVDPATGRVIDVHHPLHGESVAGTILAIPSGRGSCSGSLVVLELLLNGHAPRALVFRHHETILTLGVMIAEELFRRGIPVLRVDDDTFAELADARYATIDGATLTMSDDDPRDVDPHINSHIDSTAALGELDLARFELSQQDRLMLAGAFGEAAAIALRLVIRAALLEGAADLIDVEMAHIDGCFYQGPASLRFAHRLLDAGAKVRVPTTMNAICVDRQRWRALGVPETLGAASDELADAFVAMGVKPTYTCAPYLLDPAPAFGQQIAWGESNAVVFANSVLGARTLKYPDYLDILVALTGRAPNADCHRAEARLATVQIDVPAPHEPDDAYFALLGYHVGKIATNEIPVVCGLEPVNVSRDDLKAFGAAFATTSAVAMFHIAGVTPEAATIDMAIGAGGAARRVSVTHAELESTWREMNTATTPAVDLIALGNPHFSLGECAALAERVTGSKIAPGVSLIVTCGRDVSEQARAAGYVDAVEEFGGTFLNDTCWCFIGEPVIAPAVRCIATNSGKYAHYGPAAVPQEFHFASLERCVTAACTGQVDTSRPRWLVP